MTRSGRSTGLYRKRRGFGCEGRLPRSREERLRRLPDPEHGRGSGTPFQMQRRTRDAIRRQRDRLILGLYVGPHPHPTKRGPGRC